MPTAINPQTGELLTLGGDGQWAPAQRAKNPESGQEIYLDGAEWKPVPYRARVPERLKQRLADQDARSLRQGFMDQVVQGASMGFSDEIGAGVNATLGSVGDLLRMKAPEWGKRYDEELEYQRERLKETQAEHPILSTVGQVAGGFATAAPAVRAAVSPMLQTGRAASQTLLEIAKRGALTGGATGAVSGFGASEGGLENRLQGAGMGGAIGATLGGATPFAIEGGRRATGYLKGALGLGDQTPRAERLLARALGRDELTPTDVLARADDLAIAGSKGEVLADVGGENVKRLARAAGSVPGKGTKIIHEAVEARNLGQAERLLGDVKTYVSPVDDFHGLMDAVGAAQRRNAAPLYDAAMSAAPVSSPRLQQFLDDPLIQKALPRGVEIQRLTALADDVPFRPSDVAEVGVGGAMKVPQLGKVPNMRSLDAIKQGLDDILDEYRDKVTGRLALDQRGRAIEAVRREFVTELDRLNPNYAAARQAWAGPASAKDALAFGRRDVLRLDPEAIGKRISGMSPSEREFAKAGVARALADIVNGKADDLDVTKGFLRNPTVRARIKAVMGNDAGLDGFLAAVERERDLFKTGAFISPRTGSQTQLRQADVADLLQDPSVIGDVAPQLLQGNLRGAAIAGVRGQLPRLTEGVGNRTAEELARLLMAPAGDRAVMQRLSDRLSSDQAKRAMQARLLQHLSAGGGTAIGLKSAQ